MNSDQVTGKWNQLKGSVKEKWGKLTDDDLQVTDGKRDRLVGKLQERYGITKEKAEEQFSQWDKAKSFDDSTASVHNMPNRKAS